MGLNARKEWAWWAIGNSALEWGLEKGPLSGSPGAVPGAARQLYRGGL
jgi:hypothetical protein